MSTQDITTMLNARADEKLRRFVTGQLDPLWAKFESTRNVEWAGNYIDKTISETEKQWIGSTWKRAEYGFMEVLRNHFREEEAREFIAKVNSLSEEIDILRNPAP